MVVPKMRGGVRSKEESRDDRTACDNSEAQMGLLSPAAVSYLINVK